MKQDENTRKKKHLAGETCPHCRKTERTRMRMRGEKGQKWSEEKETKM